MTKYLLLICFLFVSLLAWPQAKSLKVYYNQWDQLCDSAQAVYYIVENWELSDKLPSKMVEKAYFVHDDSIRSITQYQRFSETGYRRIIGNFSATNVYSALIKHGQETIFHPNGSARSQRVYHNNFPIGNDHQWYPDGSPMEIGKHIPETKKYKALIDLYYTEGSDYLLADFWDSTGNHTVIKGNGEKHFFEKEGKVKVKGRYRSGKKFANWTYESIDGSFKAVEQYDTTGTFVQGMTLLSDGTKVSYDSKPDTLVLPTVEWLREVYEYILIKEKELRYIKRYGACKIEMIIEPDSSISKVRYVRGNGFLFKYAKEAVLRAGDTPPTPYLGMPHQTRFQIWILPVYIKIF